MHKFEILGEIEQNGEFCFVIEVYEEKCIPYTYVFG